jgi:hypothetical protein
VVLVLFLLSIGGGRFVSKFLFIVLIVIAALGRGSLG